MAERRLQSIDGYIQSCYKSSNHSSSCTQGCALTAQPRWLRTSQLQWEKCIRNCWPVILRSQERICQAAGRQCRYILYMTGAAALFKVVKLTKCVCAMAQRHKPGFPEWKRGPVGVTRALELSKVHQNRLGVPIVDENSGTANVSCFSIMCKDALSPEGGCCCCLLIFLSFSLSLPARNHISFSWFAIGATQQRWSTQEALLNNAQVCQDCVYAAVLLKSFDLQNISSHLLQPEAQTPVTDGS